MIGTGTDWREAVDNIAWETGDVLLLGSGAAGPMAQVFLGTAASKILRHAPVPVMIVPKQRARRRVDDRDVRARGAGGFKRHPERAIPAVEVGLHPVSRSA